MSPRNGFACGPAPQVLALCELRRSRDTTPARQVVTIRVSITFLQSKVVTSDWLLTHLRASSAPKTLAMTARCDAPVVDLLRGTVLAMLGGDNASPGTLITMPSTAVPPLDSLRSTREIQPALLAEFSTEFAHGRTSGGRWTRLRITQIGPSLYLCEKRRGPLPLEQRSATVSSYESAKAFFGGGWVVRELFANLDPVRFPRWPH